MLATGAITRLEYKKADAEPLVIKSTGSGQDPAPYFSAHVREILKTADFFTPLKSQGAGHHHHP